MRTRYRTFFTLWGLSASLALMLLALQSSPSTADAWTSASASNAAHAGEPLSSCFPSVEELEQDPAVNPHGRTLTASEREAVETIRRDFSAQVDMIARARLEAEQRVASERIRAGEGQVIAPGQRIPKPVDCVSVVVASFDGGDPRLVRIQREDLPLLSDWNSMRQELLNEGWRNLRQVFEQGATPNGPPTEGGANTSNGD